MTQEIKRGEGMASGVGGDRGDAVSSQDNGREKVKRNGGGTVATYSSVTLLLLSNGSFEYHGFI